MKPAAVNISLSFDLKVKECEDDRGRWKAKVKIWSKNYKIWAEAGWTQEEKETYLGEHTGQCIVFKSPWQQSTLFYIQHKRIFNTMLLNKQIKLQLYVLVHENTK